MSLPNPLFVLLEGGTQVKIENAVRRTRKPIIVYDKETFRDTPTAVVGGAAVADVVNNPQGVSIAGGVDPTAEDPESNGFFRLLGASSVLEEDAYLHVPKRYIPKLDTLVEFWDAETVGLAMTMSVTTVSGSAVITVPDAQLLTPGQGITGTGIPANTIILSILSQTNGVITTTTAVMSQQATASATVAATLTGSNQVGEFMQSEFLDYGSENSIPT